MTKVVKNSTESVTVNVTPSSTDSLKPTSTDKQPLMGFLLFGVVALMCFNFFLQVLGYLNTCFSSEFSMYANILYGLSNNCGQLLVVFYGSRLPFSSRIYYSCVSLAIILIAYPIVAVSTTNTSIGMTIGLTLTFGLGLFNAVLQSAGFGLAGICSPQTMGYFSLGQAVAGLAPWPLMLVLKSIYQAAGVSDVSSGTGRPSDVDTACTLTALALAALVTVAMVPFYRFSLSQSSMVKSALSNLSSMKESSLVQQRSKLQIVRATLPLAASVWLIMYVTFVVFPSQPLKWKPSYGPYPGEYFYGSMMIYVFQVFDVVGRYVVSVIKLNPSQTKIGSVVRMLTIPLFYLATYDVSFFANDVVKILIMAVFAASCGFLLSWGMINGPSQVHKDEKDIASYTMSFFLVNGIFFGSLTSLAISKIIQT